MRIARYLVAGVDVWLNNPRRPLEASGTSGMKAAVNGVRQRQRPRRLVGRGLRGDNGWAIGGRETNADEGAQDWSDVQDLYRLLEEEIVPRYYERDADGVPDRLGRPDAALDGLDALAVLDDADAPRVRRADVPARGRRAARAAAEDAGAESAAGDDRLDRGGPGRRRLRRPRPSRAQTRRSADCGGSVEDASVDETAGGDDRQLQPLQPLGGARVGQLQPRTVPPGVDRDERALAVGLPRDRDRLPRPPRPRARSPVAARVRSCRAWTTARTKARWASGRRASGAIG